MSTVLVRRRTGTGTKSTGNEKWEKWVPTPNDSVPIPVLTGVLPVNTGTIPVGYKNYKFRSRENNIKVKKEGINHGKYY